MLIATPEERALMECHDYDCEKQYGKGRCINVVNAVGCNKQIYDWMIPEKEMWKERFSE